MRHWAVFFPRIEASIVEEMNASSLIKYPDNSDSTLRDGFQMNCNGELSCLCFVVLLSCHKPETSAELLTTFVFQFIASQSELEIPLGINFGTTHMIRKPLTNFICKLFFFSIFYNIA